MSTSDADHTPLLGFTWNVPNILTVIRIVLVPVFAAVFLIHPHHQGWRIAALGVFAIAMITDSIDGYWARKYNQVTDFGKIADSIADKALTGVAFIILSVVGELPWWMTIIILIREWGITAMRFAVLKYGVISANRGGKLKTIMQSVALVLFLLWLPVLGTWFHVVKWAVMVIAFALTVFTGLAYLVEARRLKAASLAAGGRVDISQIRSHDS